MTYFITHENSTKGRDPNINIINGIHSIKGKTSVNVLVSNYANKHIMFNKGEYIGCLEPTITDSMTSDQPDTHPTTGGSCLSWIFWEHENLSSLSNICLIQLL